jgi:hypothetical protein
MLNPNPHITAALANERVRELRETGEGASGARRRDNGDGGRKGQGSDMRFSLRWRVRAPASVELCAESAQPRP